MAPTHYLVHLEFVIRCAQSGQSVAAPRQIELVSLGAYRLADEEKHRALLEF